MKPVLSFRGVMIREHPLDRPVPTIGRHEANDIVIDHMGSRGGTLGWRWTATRSS
ncbi:MAG: hypothetical protein ACHQ7N_06395 [Candidatus Methylomirabilales bacterium]